MAQQKNSVSTHTPNNEIDIITLVKTLWVSRKTVLKTTLLFVGIGLFIAIFSPKEFTASTTLLPQTNKSTKLSGNLGGLAAMAGINLGSLGTDSGISSMLYPQIVNSISFQKELLMTYLTFKGQNKKITYTKYYTEIYNPGLLSFIQKYTIGLPRLIINALKGESANTNKISTKNLFRITNTEKKLITRLKKQLVINVNKKDGYVTLTTKMPEALAAAEFAEKAQQLLQKYIIKLKIQKSKEQLKFIKERYLSKETEFKIIQKRLAQFRDKNQNLSSALSQTKLQSLQSEYDLTFNVFSELAKQLETQQLQVKENTPVFTILKQVYVPIEQSGPKRFLILILSIFLGFVVGVSLIFIKDYISKIKDAWH